MPVGVVPAPHGQCSQTVAASSNSSSKSHSIRQQYLALHLGTFSVVSAVLCTTTWAPVLPGPGRRMSYPLPGPVLSSPPLPSAQRSSGHLHPFQFQASRSGPWCAIVQWARSPSAATRRPPGTPEEMALTALDRDLEGVDNRTMLRCPSRARRPRNRHSQKPPRSFSNTLVDSVSHIAVAHRMEGDMRPSSTPALWPRIAFPLPSTGLTNRGHG